MSFILVIETDNDAFQSDGHYSHIAMTDEVVRILTTTTKQLVGTPIGEAATIIHDINGNAVGSWHLD